jgi:predicted alpha/beta-hydrolase family hydrolase
MSPVAFHVEGDAAMTHGALLYSADTTVKQDVLFVFAHGAGAGHASPWMVRYARGLAERGIDVVTFNFPYMESGRKAPDRAPVLEDAFRRVIVSAAAHRHVHASRLLVGGKSMGGRMATHLAAAPEAWPAAAPALDGVVVFGYPLNPPGGSKRSPDRVSHLLKIAVPTLIVQGTRDNFGGPDDLRAVLGTSDKSSIAVHGVEGGDHSLTRRPSTRQGSLKAGNPGGSTQQDVDGDVWDAVVAWIESHVKVQATL